MVEETEKDESTLGLEKTLRKVFETHSCVHVLTLHACFVKVLPGVEQREKKRNMGEASRVGTSGEDDGGLPSCDDEVVSMRQMEDELDRMDDSLKVAWMEAQRKCPEQVGYHHKLMFLRREDFHSQLAALRLVRYWSKRVELFGSEAAFLSLTTLEEGRSALRIRAVDMETLQLGFVQWTRQVDENGNAIFWSQWARIPPGYTRGRRNRLLRLPSLCRVLWFVVHCAMEESENMQTKGAVLLSDGRRFRICHVDIAQSVYLVKTGLGCFPVRMICVHGLYTPRFFSCIVFPCFVRRLMNDIMLDAPTYFHRGSVSDKLAMHGLPKTCLPVELGGTVVVRYNDWLEEKKAKRTSICSEAVSGTEEAETNGD